ncbi:MAG: glycosyltransferase family 2 protein [Betaproteobacteria bacterium]
MNSQHPQATLEPHRVAVVTVSYNSEAVLPDMLGSLPAGIPVIIVDNASRNQTAIEAVAERYGTTLILNEKNLGFGVACNQGAAQTEAEFLFFLNPDAVLLPGTLESLLDAAQRYPAAAAFCPRELGDRDEQIFKRRSDLLPRHLWLPHGWPSSDRALPVMHGAAMLIRSKAFASVGGFDPELFLFFEDDDLSLRLDRECGPLMFIRDTAVRHAGGRASGTDPQIDAFKAWHLGFSRVYALRKHGRYATLVRAVIAITLKALLSLGPMSAPKRTRRRSTYRGTFHALAGGKSDGYRPVQKSAG